MVSPASGPRAWLAGEPRWRLLATRGRARRGFERRLDARFKLSQWLTYSLLEPFEWAGVRDGLGRADRPAEYRNGGLLLDTGVLRPRVPDWNPPPLAGGDDSSSNGAR